KRLATIKAPGDLGNIRITVGELLLKYIDLLHNTEIEQAGVDEALTSFHHSKLAGDFNDRLTEVLEEEGINNDKANMLTEIVSRSTYREVNKCFMEKMCDVDPDNRWFFDPHRNDLYQKNRTYSNIDEYLESKVKDLPEEPINSFEVNNNIKLEEIYVPLKAKISKINQSVEQTLDEWAKNILLKNDKHGKVMFIYGDAGQGKSSFCSMFAHWAWKNLYPSWIPILVRLKDIEVTNQFETEILPKAINYHFTTEKDWLLDKNTRFLFLFDGLDELLSDRQEKKHFISQILHFQRDCFDNFKEKGHQVIITGRPLEIQGFDNKEALERAEVQPMNDSLRDKWLNKWENKVGQESADNFRELLLGFQDDNNLQNLARKPLMCYLLAVLSQDNDFIKKFNKAEGVDRKIEIYEDALKWVFNQRKEFFLKVFSTIQSDELSENKVQLYFQYVLEEAALCITQAGGQQEVMEMLQRRLQK
ncbi:MAG: NACHT domain-containing protein, partial [Candidatus Electrothrix sp. ATG2]|nr:NACHT domain-containing protein [Candidatus Electrothrix sp. ATG2]